jgi:hypothetical protein
MYIPFSINFEPKYLSKVDSWHDHVYFAADLVSELKPNLLVELGTHYGDSYFAFCQSVSENRTKTICYAIDTWEGDIFTGKYDASIYKLVLDYNILNYSNFSYLIKSKFTDAVDRFSDNSIDMLHIDGSHDYDSVNNDFYTWLPKVSENGIILIHDIFVRQKDFGVWELWEDIKTNYPTMEFTSGNGLGILQKSTKDKVIIGNITEDFVESGYYSKIKRAENWRLSYKLEKNKLKESKRNLELKDFSLDEAYKEINKLKKELALLKIHSQKKPFWNIFKRK